MITNILLLIFLTLTWSFLVSYIKNIKISNHNNQTSWMFSYDFKAEKKKDYQPEDLSLLKNSQWYELASIGLGKSFSTDESNLGKAIIYKDEITDSFTLNNSKLFYPIFYNFYSQKIYH